jgi:hypothetical protein
MIKFFNTKQLSSSKNNTTATTYSFDWFWWLNFDWSQNDDVPSEGNINSNLIREID